jgi:proteic killer suppression protein
MEVTFANDRLHKLCNSASKLNAKYGARMAKAVQRRLADLDAAESLEVMRLLPGRCHELTANFSGHLALDLEHPDRLVFKPTNQPLPVDGSGRLDWSKVTKVEIVGIGDYH